MNKLLLLAFAGTISAPLHAQDTAPAADPATAAAPDGADVTYDEALRCGFIGIAYGLRLIDSKGENPRGANPARGRNLLTLAQKYITFAESTSGKDTTGVVEDMGTAGQNLLARIDTNPNPVQALDDIATQCEAREAELPQTT